MFFGCRTEQDFLYRKELEEYLVDESLATLDVAMSRVKPGGEKVYVTHKLKERGAEIAKLVIEEGAYIYVCGDGNHMAKDVHKALIDALVEFHFNKFNKDNKVISSDREGEGVEVGVASNWTGIGPGTGVGVEGGGKDKDKDKDKEGWLEGDAAEEEEEKKKKKIRLSAEVAAEEYLKDLKCRRRYALDIWS